MVDPSAPRVLDSTSGIAGAYATLLLHQAGAEVVRAARDGDDPQLSDGSPLSGYLRQGQATIHLDGASPAGVGADVWLATPNSAERDALNAAAIEHPDLVIVAITPYGLVGPYRDRPASDLTIQADSGALAIRGQAGEAPIQMGGRTVQWLGGAYAAFTALAMWRGRRGGGPGALVDVSLAEVANIGAANFMDVFHAIEPGVDAEPTSPPRLFETPSIERTADGWVGFNTNAPHQIDGFLRMIGRDDLADSGEYMLAGQRIGRMAEWQPLVTAWTSVRTTDEIIEAALAHNVPVAPVCNGRTVVELDHVVARESLVREPGGRFTMPRRPWRINHDRGADPEPAPDPAAAPHGLPEWRERRAPVPPPGAATPVGRPLAGLRILDLTAWWAGPSATGLLAAFGADVIHVEGPARMDGMRMVGMSFSTPENWWERSPFFLTINVNKRDLVLDITSERGREVALELIAQVDAVVENFTPRVLDKLGLGWDEVHAANPRAIQVRMPAFGLDGPWRERPGFAQNIEQATSLAWVTGRADDQPRIQRGPCDPNGGLHAMIGLLAALDERDRTGEGSLVEASLFDAALPLASEAIIEWTANRQLVERDGNRSALSAPQGVYRCEGLDAWLAVSVTTDEEWRALVEVIERPDLGKDSDLADLDGRRAAHDRLDDALDEWVAGRELADAVEQLVEAGIPAAPARDPRLVVRHPQFAARGFHQVVDHPATGPLPLPTQPFRIRGVDRWVATPAPQFGEHTDEVLTELLGLTSVELAALRADGAVADRPAGV
jgi:crotonobetainyl-CoA:carnitine CoA-transferase CaiB-like acyl-CoA transferase